MKKLIAVLLAGALLASMTGVALATPVVVIDDVAPYDTPQNVSKDVDVTVDVAATILIDTDKDALYIGPLNPENNTSGSDTLDWLIKSNKPYQKTIRWTDLEGQGRENLGKTLPASQVEVTVDGRPKINPDRWGPDPSDPLSTYGPTDGHHETVVLKARVTWFDIAGPYTGKLTLDAHQM